MLKKKQGFSLLEIMVVLVIIGILAAVVAPRISTYIRDAKITGTKTEVSSIANALNSYYSVNNEYPINLSIIAKDYLDKVKLNENNSPLDPWGIPYLYKTEDSAGRKRQKFFLSSAGPDNVQGTTDDLNQSGGSKAANEVGGEEYDESLENDMLEEDLQ